MSSGWLLQARITKATQPDQQLGFISAVFSMCRDL